MAQIALGRSVGSIAAPFASQDLSSGFQQVFCGHAGPVSDTVRSPECAMWPGFCVPDSSGHF
jgi:hypothetical protein